MPHTIEAATSARAKCRGCGEKIAKGELRFGERQPNPFGDGEMSLWFHVVCGAYKRPEPFLEALEEAPDLERREWLESEARRGLEHRRLPRVDGAQRAPTGRARCRSCREMIDKGAWRFPLVYFDEARFQPSGFLHARCARPYLETIDVIDRVRHFAPDLSDADVEELRTELAASPEASEAAPEEPDDKA